MNRFHELTHTLHPGAQIKSQSPKSIRKKLCSIIGGGGIWRFLCFYRWGRGLIVLLRCFNRRHWLGRHFSIAIAIKTTTTILFASIANITTLNICPTSRYGTTVLQHHSNRQQHKEQRPMQVEQRAMRCFPFLSSAAFTRANRWLAVMQQLKHSRIIR